MKAVILVGGYGTRLRPLTLSCPKPLVEFANKPILVHQIEALQEVGCGEVILAIAYKPEVMRSFLEEWQPKFSIRITISEERELLGTAGPLALAQDILLSDDNSPFFVLNRSCKPVALSKFVPVITAMHHLKVEPPFIPVENCVMRGSGVICNYSLKDLLEFHRSRAAEATILTTKVEDPSQYGVVVMQRDGKVNCFVEKPKSYMGEKINAGIYVMNQEVLRRIHLKPTSLERDIFPAIAADNRLYGMVVRGHWTDLGKPVDLLKGLNLHLEHSRIHSSHTLAQGSMIRGNVLLAQNVQIGSDCLIGPDVSIGEGCTIGNGVRLSHCCVMRDCTIGDFTLCKNCIVGWNSSIGKWSRVENNAVLGENVKCKVRNMTVTCIHRGNELGNVILLEKPERDGSRAAV